MGGKILKNEKENQKKPATCCKNAYFFHIPEYYNMILALTIAGFRCYIYHINRGDFPEVYAIGCCNN